MNRITKIENILMETNKKLTDITKREKERGRVSYYGPKLRLTIKGEAYDKINNTLLEEEECYQ